MKTYYLIPVVLFSLTAFTLSAIADDKAVDKSGDKASAPAVAVQAGDNATGSQNEGSVTAVPTDNFAETTLSCVMSCPECSIFARAIHDSGLEEKLAQAKELTIFVPTDKAFAGWSKQDLDDLFKCKAALAGLVLNHLAPKSLSPEKLQEIKKAVLCCNKDEAVKLLGAEKAEKLAKHCQQIKDKMKKSSSVCDSNGKPCLGTGALCHSAKAYPNAVVKCNNGYVYTINQVQVPRGLRVYRELQSEQQNNAGEPVLVVEEVEISATAVPEGEDAPQSAPADDQPKDQAKDSGQDGSESNPKK